MPRKLVFKCELKKQEIFTLLSAAADKRAFLAGKSIRGTQTTEIVLHARTPADPDKTDITAEILIFDEMPEATRGKLPAIS